jgi:pyridoxamine 5'-phosphate oxidase
MPNDCTGHAKLLRKEMSDTAPIEHPSGLTSGDFGAADEPLRLFAAWLTDATASEPRDPTAMTLATVDEDGLPNARMVLLKGADERGFVFYTNMDSKKGRELDKHPAAALVFHWKSSNRQVRVRGPAERVTDAEADAYFATRPKQAQIGAWASKQSSPLESRLAFEKAVALYAAKYAIGAVPRPPSWSGYRIVPLAIEFWQERPFRLHDRIEFRRPQPGAAWSKTRLYP